MPRHGAEDAAIVTQPHVEPQAGEDPLRLTICPECFYSLHGLPLKGACPECGQQYDQGGVVIYGWPLREAQERVRSGISLWIGWGFLCAVYGAMIWGDRGRNPSNWIMLAILGGFPLLRLLQRRLLYAPARLQVSFDASGIRINPKTGDLGFGRRRFIPWRKIGQVRITPHKAGGYLIYVASPYIAWFLLLREYLRLVVELTDAQQGALYDRIQAWRREAAES